MKVEVTMFVPVNQFDKPFTGCMHGEYVAYHESRIAAVIEDRAYETRYRTSRWNENSVKDPGYREVIERQMRHELMREIEKELFGE